MRTFLEPTAIRRAAFIILLGWFIPLTGALGAMVFSPGGENVNEDQDLMAKGAVKSKDNRDLDEKGPPGAGEQARMNSNNANSTANTTNDNNAKNNQQEQSGKANQNSIQSESQQRRAHTAGHTSAGTYKTAQSTEATTNAKSPARSGDLNLLARVIHAEARGEPLEGQVAVGAVLLNRVESAKFPNNLWGIIFKKGEFCTVRDGQVWMNPNAQAYKAARMALSGWDPTHGALYFYNPAKTTSKWIWSRPVTTEIGSHLFAR